jgi:hypothetical protein
VEFRGLPFSASPSRRAVNRRRHQPLRPRLRIQSPAPGGLPLDPCPERLQDLAGHCSTSRQYSRLPTLEDLPPLKPGTPLALTCPLTNQKYIYNPDGIKFSNNRWAVVYDPTPSHSNYRWAIVFAALPNRPRPGSLGYGHRRGRIGAATEFPTFSK